jgi:hypothetical protein
MRIDRIEIKLVGGNYPRNGLKPSHTTFKNIVVVSSRLPAHNDMHLIVMRSCESTNAVVLPVSISCMLMQSILTFLAGPCVLIHVMR